MHAHVGAVHIPTVLDVRGRKPSLFCTCTYVFCFLFCSVLDATADAADVHVPSYSCMFVFRRDAQDAWYKFEDDDVTPFNPQEIEHNCFGGTTLTTPSSVSISFDRLIDFG